MTSAAEQYRANVGIVLINRAGRIFAAQRLDSEVPAWQMPQGGVDDGEDPREAALRELEEEIGVPADQVRVVAETAGWLSYDLPPEIAARMWKGRYRGQRQKWFLLRFLGRDQQIDLRQAHPEFSAWKWIDPAEMIAEIVPFKRDVYRAVIEEFRAYLTPES